MRHIIKATVLDKNNKVIATATNSYQKTHPLQAKYASQCGEPYKVYLHAEIAALIRARGQGHKIKIERYNKHGQPMLAAPCPICQLAIKEAGIKYVEYTV